eukprot:COSAG01_NODE_21496_length_899_cov_3.605000_1_plen_25_part_10
MHQNFHMHKAICNPCTTVVVVPMCV